MPKQKISKSSASKKLNEPEIPERISGLQYLAWILGLIAVALLIFQIIRTLLS